MVSGKSQDEDWLEKDGLSGNRSVRLEGEEIIEGGRGGRSLVAILLVHLFAVVSSSSSFLPLSYSILPRGNTWKKRG